MTDVDQERAVELARVSALGLDKACQANCRPDCRATVHIDPKTTKEEIAGFAEFIKVIEVRSSLLLEFWPYYFRKRDGVQYILRLNLVDITLLEVA